MAPRATASTKSRRVNIAGFCHHRRASDCNDPVEIEFLTAWPEERCTAISGYATGCRRLPDCAAEGWVLKKTQQSGRLQFNR
jgi:hypothetical protein